MKKTDLLRKTFSLDQQQYGFQANKSTMHAIIDTLTTTYDQISNNDNTGIVLLDFKTSIRQRITS